MQYEVYNAAAATSSSETMIDMIFDFARTEGRRALDEYEAKRVLAALGIDVPRGVRVADAGGGEAAAQLRPPLVVKGLSPHALHKSDIGAVKLGIEGAAELRSAMIAITENMKTHAVPFDGFLIEEMAPSGTELVVGGTVDPQLGPMVMVGAGGIYTEIFRDVSFRLCPVSAEDAREMIGELKVATILNGARGRDAADVTSIERMLLAVAGEDGFFTRYAGHITELDLNPVIVRPDGLTAVDCRIVLGGAT